MGLCWDDHKAQGPTPPKHKLASKCTAGCFKHVPHDGDKGLVRLQGQGFKVCRRQHAICLVANFK